MGRRPAISELWVVKLLSAFLAHAPILRDIFPQGPRLKLTIDSRLDSHESGEWFFRGSIENKGLAAKNCEVILTGFLPIVNGSSVNDRALQWTSGVGGRKDIYSGPPAIFDIASVSGNPNTRLVFHGFVNNVRQAGAGVSPGQYNFSLHVTGENFKAKSWIFEILVKNGGGANCVEVLRVREL